ncbi:MAG: TetR/AcrR family transcriptional regulator [Lentimicrobium sp.]|jgi:AcrR family transcriptional regulator|nr:TetR/AcrR family transcriptional regulator [Lentimicrobium sp.]
MQTDRQREITDAALELIHEKGIQGLTIKNLAARIGVTEPAIYRHFENKISILTTILEVFKGHTSTIFEKELQGESAFLDKIERLFSKHFEYFTKKPSLSSVIFSEELFRNEPELIRSISGVIEHNQSLLVKIIRKGQITGEIRDDTDASSLALVLMGALRLFVKKWQLSGFSFDLELEGSLLFLNMRRLISKH